MNLEKAINILGVEPKDTKEDVHRRYRNKVKECHPDNIGWRKCSDISIHELTEAKKAVYNWMESLNTTAPAKGSDLRLVIPLDAVRRVYKDKAIALNIQGTVQNLSLIELCRGNILFSVPFKVKLSNTNTYKKIADFKLNTIGRYETELEINVDSLSSNVETKVYIDDTEIISLVMQFMYTTVEVNYYGVIFRITMVKKLKK